MTVPTITIIEACDDPALFARWFRTPETWRAWFVFLRALFGLPMSAEDLVLFKQCTGRDVPPEDGAREGWLVVGRRGGKSLVLALCAAFLACFVDWRPHLTDGERGTIMVIAADRRQARTIYRYVRAMLRVPLLAALVERQTDETIDLTNGVTIEIAVASYKSVRGYTLIAALCDELAFWRTDEGSSNPDAEIIAALRPAMATIPGALLLCASSPYARRGTLWTTYRRHFGRADSPVLVWQSDTATMNPTVAASVIAEAYALDAASAAAEFGAEFRADVETFVSREVVDACVVAGRHELPPVPGLQYCGFVDPSGGSSDAMTLCVAHREGDRVVIDAVRERRPPFSPDDAVLGFVALLRSYGVRSVSGDRYAGLWPSERFKVHGVEYVPCEQPKSDIYRDFLPRLNAHRVELLDHPRLVAQLTGLERRTPRGGRDSIDHPPGAHDDIANAVAGCCAMGGFAAVDWSHAGAIAAQIRQHRYTGYGRLGRRAIDFNSLPCSSHGGRG